MHFNFLPLVLCLMSVSVVMEGAMGRPSPAPGDTRPESRRSRRYLTGGDPWLQAWDAVHLTSQTGYNLAVNSEGHVVGSSRDGRHATIQRHSIDAGLVLLRSVQSGRYIGMNGEGQLITTETISEENHFVESMTSNFYTTFHSHKYARRQWYIGIRRNGHVYRNRRVRHQGGAKEERQAFKFMVRPVQT